MCPGVRDLGEDDVWRIERSQHNEQDSKGDGTRNSTE